MRWGVQYVCGQSSDFIDTAMLSLSAVTDTYVTVAVRVSVPAGKLFSLVDAMNCGTSK